MEDKQFEIISRKLNSIIKLHAYNIIVGKPVMEQIKILSGVGLTASEIGDMLGKTENQVYVTLNQIKKAKKKSEKETTVHEQSNQSEIQTNV